MSNVTEILARNIKRRRRELGLTQQQLAHLLGYSEKAVSKWERGNGAPPTVILPMLAALLQTGVDALLHEESGERYYLGIDGGGTKTEFALADGKGKVLRRVILGASNPNDVGFPATEEILRNGIMEVCGAYPKNAISVFAGLAGGTSKENLPRIHDYLVRFGFAKVQNGNDAQNAVAASLGDEDGISVIMGTGSVVYAKHGERLHRIGGYGYLFGDAGSGFAIGRDTILAAFQSEDGSGEETCLLDYVKEQSESDTVLAQIDEFYRGGKRLIATYAHLAFRACEEGDAVAKGILESNLGAIAQLIRGAAKQIPTQHVRVVLCGGLTAHRGLLLPLLQNALAGDGRSYELGICERPIVFGALRLAGMPQYQNENESENGGEQPC